MKRQRKLKVYIGNYDGRMDALMACYNFAEFHHATGINRDFGEECDIDAYRSVALASPWTIFVRPTISRSEKWIEHKRLPRPDVAG